MIPSISLFQNAKATSSSKSIPYDIFLDSIRDGKWQDIVLPLRAITDKEQRTEAKKKVPAVTIAGIFKARNDQSIETHSGLVAIDIDEVEDTHQLKKILSADKYVAAAFVSISGRGLCLIIKINPAKHKEAFQGFAEYLYENYKIIADPTSINPSRL